MTAAVEVYGGGERLISVMQADTVEAHYLSAWNAVLRGERGRALQHFECEWLAALDDFRNSSVRPRKTGLFSRIMASLLLDVGPFRVSDSTR